MSDEHTCLLSIPSFTHILFRKPTISHEYDFTFDKDRNVYICPAGRLLTTTGRVHKDNAVRYLAKVADCRIVH